MNKKEVKLIEITSVVINHLSGGMGICDEWETSCNVDFILSSPFVFNVFDKEHTIDRVKMGTMWGEDVVLYYASNEMEYVGFPVTKTLIHKVYDRVISEQKNGCLKGWSFEDYILEMLKGERKTSPYLF